MQNFSKQTKRALEFVERLSEGGYGEKTEICCSDECSGRLTCNIGCISARRTFENSDWTSVIQLLKNRRFSSEAANRSC